jgi:hypothetical protein
MRYNITIYFIDLILVIFLLLTSINSFACEKDALPNKRGVNIRGLEKIDKEIIWESGRDLDYCLSVDGRLRRTTTYYLEIECSCGVRFQAIPIRSTFREMVAMQKWESKCPSCKMEFECYNDLDKSPFRFFYNQKEAFCDDTNCKYRFIKHIHSDK